MSALGDAWRRHLRITMLRLMASAPGEEANESLLTDALRGEGEDSDYGFTSLTRDQVCAELEWLHEQGLVELRRPGGLAIARLTARGEDVAAGRVEVHGVKRPSRRS